jgi:hypothetical protein
MNDARMMITEAAKFHVMTWNRTPIFDQFKYCTVIDVIAFLKSFGFPGLLTMHSG